MRKKKDPAAVALGRKGGKARMKTMTPEARKAQATAAVNARWNKPGLKKKITSLLSDMPCDLSYDEIIAEEPVPTPSRR